MEYKSSVDIATLEGNDTYKNDKGNHECVVLVQKAAGAPNTMQWVKGKKVLDFKPGGISRGTVIATFNEDGRYPATAGHAALYKDHDAEGIWVLDQWNSQGMVKERKIRLKNLPERNVNDAKYYFIVD